MENITVFIISFFLLVVVCSSSAFVIHHQNETQLSLKHRPPFTENLNIRRTKTKQTDVSYASLFACLHFYGLEFGNLY